MNVQRFLFLLFFLLLVISAVFFGAKTNLYKEQSQQKQISQISFVFDWTPNTNHTGIYVALAKGWYKQAGIDIKFLPYSSAVLPDLLVAAGKADVGISSTEGVVADAALGNPVVSIAAIMQHNTSALAVRKDSGLSSPSQFDNKIYGGFGAPYEEAVIGTIIKRDGGIGVFKNITLDVGAIDALKSKRIDVAWIFLGWDGILAKREGIELRTFPISEYGIPDYSTPNIIASTETIKKKPALLMKFMKATARGYEYARLHPAESAKILMDQAPKGTFADPDFVYESQAYVSAHYADKEKKWGIQEKEVWHKYPQFMLDAKAVLDAEGKPVAALNFDNLYTNKFLE